jgi:hypothetical protein
MSELNDFVAGRSNRLLRDFLATSIGVMAIFSGALFYLSNMLEPPKVAQSLPRPLAESSLGRDAGVRTSTVIRSVLDEPVVTGSISNSRPIILDPCTGTEKSR